MKQPALLACLLAALTGGCALFGTADDPGATQTRARVVSRADSGTGMRPPTRPPIVIRLPNGLTRIEPPPALVPVYDYVLETADRRSVRVAAEELRLEPGRCVTLLESPRAGRTQIADETRCP